MLRRLVLSLLFATALAPSVSRATTFTITSGPITVSGTVFGAPTTPQAGSSNTNFAFGTIEATVTPTSITFTGGSVVDFNAQAGTFLPLSLPADFADQALPFGGAYGPTYGAYRDATIDYTSGLLAVDGSGDFTVGGTAIVTGGVFDFAYPGQALTASAPLGDFVLSPNAPAALGHVQVIGAQIVLTLPIDTLLSVYTGETLLASGRVQGTLTAVAPIPEPSALSMMGLGLAGLGWHRRRKR